MIQSPNSTQNSLRQSKNKGPSIDITPAGKNNRETVQNNFSGLLSGGTKKEKSQNKDTHEGLRQLFSQVDIKTDLEDHSNTANHHSIKTNFAERFKKLADNPEAFHGMMTKVYGAGMDRSNAERLRQKANQGDFSWLPQIEARNAKDMNGGLGAYDKKRDVVYLNKEIINNPDKAMGVYAEEVGHALDTKFKKNDTKGDEGEMFSRLLMKEKLSSKEVDKIRNENDHGVVNVDGRQAKVEFSRLSVDDITSEIKDQTFSVDRNFSVPHDGADHSFSTGQVVTVENWPVDSPTATVYIDEPRVGKIRITMPKSWLSTSTEIVPGIRKYSVGIPDQKSAVNNAKSEVESTQANIDKWKAEEDSYINNRGVWEQELNTLEQELNRQKSVLYKKEKVLSQMLVRETMYNRFDPSIVKWVDHYNDKFKPTTKLDPNLVKSMMFQETRMGTSGRHLEMPPYTWTVGGSHPIKTIYNLGQTVDSSGPQQYLMIKEMAPEIFTKYNLDSLEPQAKWKGMSGDEYYTWNNGGFVNAMKEFFEERDPSDQNLMGNSGKDLNMDYDFWTRTSVRWLFNKKHSINDSSWSEATRAYNGTGKEADSYRDAVISRVGSNSTLNVGNN